MKSLNVVGDTNKCPDNPSCNYGKYTKHIAPLIIKVNRLTITHVGHLVNYLRGK